MRLICLIILLFTNLAAINAQTTSLAWIEALTDSIVNETDLCEACLQNPPRISNGIWQNESVFFLRYGCTKTNFYSEMFNDRGKTIGVCTFDPDFCSNPNFDIITAFTFAEDLRKIWGCSDGFNCNFSKENNLPDTVSILVNDELCTQGKKILYLATKYKTYNWTSDNITSSDQTIEIDAPGIYDVELTDDLDCIKTGRINIPNIESLTVNLRAPPIVCEGDSFTIFTDSFPTYEWSTGQIEQNIKINSPGTYQVTVSLGDGCIGIGQTRIDIINKPNFTIALDNENPEAGDSIQISLEEIDLNSIASIDWFDNGRLICASCDYVTIMATENTKIEVLVKDINGCIFNKERSIAIIEKDIEVYIPNIIFLGSTKGNSAFLIQSEDAITIKALNIFDRWGNLLFDQSNISLNDPQASWNGTFNGKKVKSGVYGYRVQLSSEFANDKELIGQFTVIE